MGVGLKDSLRETWTTKGTPFIRRVKDTKLDFVYAWQRAWKGYDPREIWDMNTGFVEKYKAILKDYRKNHWCLFNVPEEYRESFGKLIFDGSETNDIIDTMIFHLEMMDEDYVEKVLYGKNIYDDDYDFKKDFSIEKTKRVWSVVDQNKEAFMRLFNLFFWQLWD